MNTITLWLMLITVNGGNHPVAAERFTTAQDCQQAVQRVEVATKSAFGMKQMFGACVEVKAYKP
jgi:hypothetical protein